MPGPSIGIHLVPYSPADNVPHARRRFTQNKKKHSNVSESFSLTTNSRFGIPCSCRVCWIAQVKQQRRMACRRRAPLRAESSRPVKYSVCSKFFAISGKGDLKSVPHLFAFMQCVALEYSHSRVLPSTTTCTLPKALNNRHTSNWCPRPFASRQSTETMADAILQFFTPH